VPVLLPTAGRHYHGGDFAEHIGMFADVLPLVADPDAPGLVDAAVARASFVEKNNVAVTALIADPLLAARYPRAAWLLASALAAHVPVLDAPCLRGPVGAALQPGGFATRPVWIAGPRPVIHVTHDDGRLAISALPCADPTFFAHG
jgi:hypothetical protein